MNYHGHGPVRNGVLPSLFSLLAAPFLAVRTVAWRWLPSMARMSGRLEGLGRGGDSIFMSA